MVCPEGLDEAHPHHDPGARPADGRTGPDLLRRRPARIRRQAARGRLAHLRRAVQDPRQAPPHAAGRGGGDRSRQGAGGRQGPASCRPPRPRSCRREAGAAATDRLHLRRAVAAIPRAPAQRASSRGPFRKPTAIWLAHAKPLHDLAVEKIDRRTIAIRLAEIAEQSGPAAANRVRASLSAYFAWLLREGILEANPVLNTNRAVEAGARTHVVADDELALIWRALGEDQYSAIIKLLLLTGARRDEIASLRWSEIDLDRAVITLPPARTKNRREHLIPLAPAAVAILQAQPRRVRSRRQPARSRVRPRRPWLAGLERIESRSRRADSSAGS